MIVMGPAVALAVEDIISLLNDESEYTRQDAREILVNVVRESDQGLHRLKRNENFRNWVATQGKTMDEVVEELRNPVMWQMLHQSKSERPQFCEVCASLVHPTPHPLKYSRKGPVYACSFCGHTMN
jgi:hypothetical protein